VRGAWGYAAGVAFLVGGAAVAFFVVRASSVAGPSAALQGYKVSVDAALRMWLPATLAHELHHSRRIQRGPGYGATLGEALVSEGLADAFVHEAFPSTPSQPWDHALSESQLEATWLRAKSELWSPYSVKEHQRWFFGVGGDVPRWAGYSLGYWLVSQYRTAHGDIQPSTLVRSSAHDIAR
jgi:uncharacterized protein YjaZ